MVNNLFFYSILSFSLFTLFAHISYNLNLVDIPIKRSVHSKPIPYTGGVILSFIYIYATYSFKFSISTFDLIFSSAFLIGIVGFIDDKIKLNVGSKLSLQIIPIIYLIITKNFELNSIGDYQYFELKLNSFSIPFTLLCVLFLINAFNYFDGLDGTLVFTSVSVLCILLFLISNKNIEQVLIVVLIPLLIFLCFNFSLFKLPKLFLGDSGSMLLGFIFSFILIFLEKKNFVPPILIAWSVVIFIYEFLSINIIRLKIKKKLFAAGQDHLHHILFKITKSIFLTNIIISLMNILLFLVGYLSFYQVNSLMSLLLYIFLFIIYFIFRAKIHKTDLKIKTN